MPSCNECSEPIVSGWVAVHVDEKDTVTRRVRGLSPADPPPPGFADTVQNSDNRFTGARAFDFDRDGDPELYIGAKSFGAGCDPAEFADGLLLTYRSGRIVPYEPAARFAIWDMKDVDADGLPDLLTSSPYASFRPPRSVGVYMFAPDLVAHARRDGTFATNDAVAVGAARRACPRKPTDAELAPAPDRVPEDIARATVCALLWGVSKDAVSSAVGEKLEALEEIIRVTPPVRLR